jgi:hypothetical protein
MSSRPGTISKAPAGSASASGGIANLVVIGNVRRLAAGRGAD